MSYIEPHEPWDHRDGVKLSAVFVLRTETAAWRTSDARGRWGCHDIYVAETELDGSITSVAHPGWHVVIAIPADIHHSIMTEDEADKFAEMVKRSAARVRDLNAVARGRV